MDLRSLPDGLTPKQRIDARRGHMERGLKIDLSLLAPREEIIGEADSRNCEQMFGVVPIPVGYAGPLPVVLSSGERTEIHLPLATTEAALVASVNRGCKAIAAAGGAKIEQSVHHGATRSLAFSVSPGATSRSRLADVRAHESAWKSIGESTSGHLKILSYDIDVSGGHLFLTIACDTGEAMGMNMVTIAAQAIGEWMERHIDGLKFITVAGNVESDKKPSGRTHERGRGFAVTAGIDVSADIVRAVLKTTPEAMLEAAHAKLTVGSSLARAIGANLHAANTVAALFLATGQDAAHVVEGSLADTTVEGRSSGLRINVRLPAVLVGVRGGGTELPVQRACLDLLLQRKTSLPRKQQLAECVAVAVLAGELSLLAAQASHTLANAHRTLAR